MVGQQLTQRRKCFVGVVVGQQLTQTLCLCVCAVEGGSLPNAISVLLLCCQSEIDSHQ